MRVIHTISKQTNPYFGSLVEGLNSHGVEAEHGYLSIRGSLSGLRYDIVHVHFVSHRPLGFLDEFTRLAWYRLLGSRIVKTCHNIRPHSTIHPRLAYWFERVVSRIADHILFFTNEQREEFCAYYRFKPASYSLISHPHPDNYDQSMDRATARSSLGLGRDDFVYLIFGVVRADKNYDRVIESFQQQHSTNDRLLVAISQHGVSPSDASAFERCRHLLARDNRDIIPHFGLLPNDEVQRYFKAADVLLVPFTDNTSSTTFMMSFTFEIPFISVGNAFNRHVVPDSCGIYMRSLDELPHAMRKIKECDLPLMRREIAIRRREYSWDKAVSEHLEAYASILQPMPRVSGMNRKGKERLGEQPAGRPTTG
jgi:glycosyltransferase involved in cell wall biosynthesis